MKPVSRTVRDFLLSNTNREFLIFLSFLALAGIFWLMMQLNETYEYEVKMCVRYDNVPKNAVLTSGETDTMRVVMRDKGFNILSYVYGQTHTPLSIDFARHTKGTSTGTVSGAELLKMASEEIPASAKIVSVKPERLLFYYNNGESKHVPVAVNGTVKAQDMYFIASTHITPDSVTVYAPKEKLDSIGMAITEEINFTDLHDTLTISAKLLEMTGVKIIPNRVNITFTTDVLTEAKIEGIPIEGINMPEGKTLRTFPAKTSVRFASGMKKYQQLSPQDFKVVADYEEFSQSPSTKCRIALVNMPDGISKVRLENTQVDYLIEEE